MNNISIRAQVQHNNPGKLLPIFFFSGSSIMTPVPHQGTVLVDLMMDDPEYISVDEQVIIIK